MKEILKYLKGTFSKDHPVERGIYVILGGTYSGEYFIFLKDNNTHIDFFSLPDKKIRNVPKESFYSGLKNKLVDFIEQLPLPVFKEVEIEFNRINNNNGHGKTNKNSEPNKWSARRA